MTDPVLFDGRPVAPPPCLDGYPVPDPVPAPAGWVVLPAGVRRQVGRHAHFEATDGSGPAWYVHDHATNGLLCAYRLRIDGPVSLSGQGFMATDARIAYEPAADPGPWTEPTP